MVKNIHIVKLLLENPQEIYKTMLDDLEFRKFVKDNENNSIEEIAEAYNIVLF